jgi:MoxR-like ATPase
MAKPLTFNLKETMTTKAEISRIAVELSRLGSATIRGAHLSHFGVNSSSVGDMATNLAGAVARGDTTLAVIKAATPLPTAGTSTGSTDPAVKALESTTNRAMDASLEAHQLAMNAKQGLGDLATRVSTVADMSIEVADKLIKLERSLNQKLGEVKGEVDPVALQSQVAKAVADTFAPFKQAATAEVMTDVADLAGVYVTECKSVREVFGVDVRNAKGDIVGVDIWNHPNAPAIDPNFIWTESILKQLLLSQSTGEHLWFGGEKGTGKSETARQFAARTGRNYVRINFHKYTSAEDYLGAVGLVNGATVFQPKDFLMAYTCPSTVILLDEVTNADAGELAPLNGFLEPNSAVSYGGAVRRKANGVLVFAADNTLGNGDDSGRYAGTRTMNSALVDRFARVVHFDYLPMKQEVEAVVRHTGCTDEVARHVLKAIHVARSKVTTGDIVDAPSIRSVIGFIRALAMLSVEEAWKSAVVSRQPAESHATLASVYAACIDPTYIHDHS